MFERNLVPTDGSEAADAALDHALDVATVHGATVQVLFADTDRDSLTRFQGEVVDALESEGQQVTQREGQQVVETAVDRVTQRGVTGDGEVVQGCLAETIREYTDRAEVEAFTSDVAAFVEDRLGVTPPEERTDA